MRGSDSNTGRLCIWTSELQGEKPDVLSGTFPDDGAWTDFHYPTVLNGKQNGNAQYHFCLGTAFGTFLLKQAYMGLPKDLEEAARLDGCNIGQTFLFIMAPLTRSSMVALGIFTAVFAYKDLMWPLICNKDVMPLSAALAKMQGQYTNNYPQLMAASLLACIPMIVLYLIFQKQFIEGIATSGGKL